MPILHMKVGVLVGQHLRHTSIILLENGCSKESVVGGSDFKSGAEFRFLLMTIHQNEMQTCPVLLVIHSKLHKKSLH